MNEKYYKICLGIRIALWITALIATLYWIVWSFKIYGMGIHDPYDYVKIFRPKFTVSLIISLASLFISFKVRKFSFRFIERHTKEED